MRPQIFFLLISIVCFCSVSGAARALNPSTEIFSKTAASKSGLTDESFIGQAVLGNLLEIELAKTALNKTRDPGIQGFAQRVIFDNNIAAAELIEIATSPIGNTETAANGAIDIPYQLDVGGLQKLDALNALFGDAFDSAFSAHMYAAQTQTLALFSAAVHDTELPGVLRLFAIKMLSTLQSHQLDAKALASKSAVPSQPLLRL